MRTITTQKKQFEYNDKLSKVYLKRLVRLFSSFNRALGGLSMDELNKLDGAPNEIIQLTDKLYSSIQSLIYEYLLAVATYYYGYVTEKKTKNNFFYGEIDRFDGQKGRIDFDPNDFVNEYLEKYNPVTQYLFFPEVERKKSRLAESVIAVQTPKHTKALKIAAIAAAIATAQRLMARQMEQYGDCVTLAVTRKAYKDCGVEMVVWHTQEDLRVCPDCDKLDKKIFPIDEVPPPQHYNCRCWVSPLKI